MDSLFCCDPDGRLRSINEHSEPPAPRFFMGRTRHGNVWRFRYDMPAAAVEQLNLLCQSEPLSDDWVSPPRNYAAIKAILHSQAPLSYEYRGPAYWIAEDIRTVASAVPVSVQDAELLRNGFAWAIPRLHAGDGGPIAAVIEQGSAVSICFCARRPGRATEAGIETLPAFRGKGYATAAVARWAAEVRRQGTIPLYSTSWDNLASQAIACRLRMVFYGEDWWIL